MTSTKRARHDDADPATDRSTARTARGRRGTGSGAAASDAFDAAEGEREQTLLDLQREAGNGATQRAVRAGAGTGLGVQPELRVGSPNDRDEREAERVARAVMRPRSPRELGAGTDGATGGPGALRRSAMGAGGTPPVTDAVADGIDRERGGGRALPPATRSFFESRLGSGLGAVRVHDDPLAARLASALDARAFAFGRDVFFGAGEFRPTTTEGRRLLAHELAHVVQQRGSPRRIRRAPDPDPPSSTTVPPAEGAEPGRTVSPESPPRAGLSVSMNGLTFLPPEGTRFRPGTRARQGIEIALYRLVGEESYSVGLADEFYRKATEAGWGGLGSLAGEAAGGEEVTQFTVPTSEALHSTAWLEHAKELTVLLSDSQRELLHLGAATSAAWNDLNVPAVAREIDVSLPAWFGEPLFRARMAQNVGLLRAYIDAVTRYRADPSGANRQAVVDALATVVYEFEFYASVLEGVRADDALVDHWVYQLLWPTTRPPDLPEGDEPTPTKAPPDRAPVPALASQFLSFLHSQETLVLRSWTESEARLELLDRFGRFLERGVSSPAAVDQQVQERPGAANAPPIPAVMHVSPPLSGPAGGPQYEASSEADYRFVMSIQFPDVYAAFQSYYYEWNYVRVPEDRSNASFDELDPQTPSAGDVAARRFGRAGRYAEEDLETVFDELGPAGVAAVSLVAANAILRYVGTGISLGIEVLTTPASEKNVSLPGSGIYLVRCKAIPYTGENAEVVRPPSVAFYPVIVRDPVELAERRNRENAAASARELDRMRELQGLLSQPVSHSNEEELRRELDTLERSLASVGGALDVQRERLIEYRDSLPAGSAERDRVEDQLDRLDRIVEVRAERAEDRELTGAEPLIATFVSDRGESIRLTMEALRSGTDDGQVEYWVSDLTTPNSSTASGTGDDRAEAIMDAVESILSGYAGYGRGYVAVQIDGRTHSLRIKASLGSLFTEAVENVTMALSIAAVAAAPFTGGASLALLLPVGAVGAVPSGYRVVNRAIDDTLRFDMATVTDIVTVVGGVAGLGHAATPLRMVNTGRVFYVMGLGADGLGMLLVPAEIASQIAALEGLPPGERAARLMEILGQAMLDAGITAGGTLAQRAQQRRIETGSSSAPPLEHTPARTPSGTLAPPTDPAAHPRSLPEPESLPDRRAPEEPAAPRTESVGERPAHRTGPITPEPHPRPAAADAANWSAVEDLVGRPIADVAGQLPPEYVLYTRADGQAVVRRTTADDALYARLTVDEDGILRPFGQRPPGAATTRTVDLSAVERPADYTEELVAADLRTLGDHRGELFDRLGRLQTEGAADGTVDGGLFRILKGNIGEILARRVQGEHLARVLREHPDAELFANVRARLPTGEEVLFSDNVIGSRRGDGFQLHAVFEVKAGGRGGQEATTQVHQSVEKHLDDGFELLLSDGTRYRYDPQGTAAGRVVGLARAERVIITARGAEHLGLGSADQIAAPVVRKALSRSSADIDYLARQVIETFVR